jgi:hypothetical protein
VPVRGYASQRNRRDQSVDIVSRAGRDRHRPFAGGVQPVSMRLTGRNERYTRGRMPAVSARTRRIVAPTKGTNSCGQF